MIKKITSLLLTVLLFLIASYTVFAADLQIKGKTQLSPGDTTEYIILVNGCEKATAASVDITCGDGLTVQSGSFIKEGSLKFFDTQKNKGAIGGLDNGDINGEFFKFTVKAQKGDGLSRNFTVTVTAKNGAETVFNQSATLIKNSPVTPKDSSQSVTVSSGGATTLSQYQKTAASAQTASAQQNNENGSQIDDTSPVLYIIFAVAVVAVAVLLIVIFKNKNKKSNSQD